MSPLFLVTEDQIRSLGPRFTHVMNRLLRSEVAALGLRGISLVVTDGDTIADGGVDATIEGVPAGHSWLPDGLSAWQFKSGNFAPKKCADEASDAVEAHRILREGGSYVIANARGLTKGMLNARKESILRAFRRVEGLAGLRSDQVVVLNAEMLASWASSRTPIVASEYFTSFPDAMGYEEWQAVTEDDRGTIWVEDEALNTKVSALQELLLDESSLAIRVEGAAGIGKSKTVLRACGEENLSPSVVVVAGFDGVSDLLKRQIAESPDDVILVVNDCTRREFSQLCDRFSFRGNFKLVGLGEPADDAIPDVIIEIPEMPRPLSEEFLKVNARTITEEGRRFVIEHFHGNPRMMLTAVTRIVRDGGSEAAELIRRNDVTLFLERILPEGRDFFFAATVALFRRLGAYKELSPSLSIAAAFAGCDDSEALSSADRLIESGILLRRGRYLSISSKPLAIYLASQSWRTSGQRIVQDLVPLLKGDSLASFFERQADLGAFEPMTNALKGLFFTGGEFDELQDIQEQFLGHVLAQIAVILPNETMSHLTLLFDSSTNDELRALHALRRDLVWTLEKLVWHSRTFVRAADCLLRLALAENEEYANNATGIWVSLFGTFLPSTAALPMQRLAYLQSKLSLGPDTERLLILACSRALYIRGEWVTVSGELQGGSIPEPRGVAQTWDEAQQYWEGMFTLLSQLSQSENAEISIEAAKSLVGCIHSHLDNRWSKDALLDALRSLRSPSQRLLVRREVEHLTRLYEKHDTGGREALKSALDSLRASLPEMSPMEEIMYLKGESRWTLGEDEIKARLSRAIPLVLDSGGFEDLIHEMSSPNLSAAWEMGFVLGAYERLAYEYVDGLVGIFPVNPNSLIGYLHGRMSTSDDGVFLEFVMGAHANALSTYERALVVSRAPVNPERLHYVYELIGSLVLVEAIRILSPWRDALTASEVNVLLSDWTSRIRTDEDYVELLGWISLTASAFDRDKRSESLDVATLWQFLQKRAEHRDIGQLDWDWIRLAHYCVPTLYLELAELMIQLMESGKLMIIGPDERTALFCRCIDVDPGAVWEIIGKHLLGSKGILNSELRGWLIESVPPTIIRNWIGGDSQRARAIAYLAHTNMDGPTDLVVFLIDTFGEVDEVRDALMNNVISGSWTGPESARIQEQIDRFDRWKANSHLSVATRRWAQYVLDYLQTRLVYVREFESERDYT